MPRGEGPRPGQRQRGGSYGPGSSGAQSSPSRPDSEASTASEGEEYEGFDFTLVQPFVKAVKKALKWEEPVLEPSRKKRFFKHARKSVQTFPLLEEVKDLFDEEWKKVEKKSPRNRLAKLYPFKEEEMTRLENAPQVDLALLRLAKHVTLPLEDTVSFKDVLDRRVENDLKKVYTTAGAACKPALALTSVSKALEVWAGEVEDAVQSDNLADIPDILKDVKLSASFLAEASIDLVRLLARVMLGATTGRRALWLKPWIADPISKQSWCKIPFEGHSLFGNKLDTAISKLTGGKSGFLPQDLQLLRKGKYEQRSNPQMRLREARNYRPGKGSKRPWKSPQRTAAATTRAQPFRGRGDQRSF